MEKSWRVRAIERKLVRGDDPIEYFLPTRVMVGVVPPEEAGTLWRTQLLEGELSKVLNL